MIQGMVMFPGAYCIVEFMQNNSPQIAWTLEESGNKLRLLLQNRRESTLAKNRILPWSGPVYNNLSREEALNKLSKHQKSREDIRKEIDAADLWELVHNEIQKASAMWFAELTNSAPNIDTVAAYGQALIEARAYFKFQPPEFEVYPEEIVEKRIAEQKAEKIREALAKDGRVLVGKLWEVHTKKLESVPQDNLSPELAAKLKNLILKRIAAPESTEDDSLWKLLIKGLPDDPLLPIYLAEAWKIIPPHYNYWLDRADYHTNEDWWEEYSETIAKLSTPDLTQLNNLEHLPYISIDSPTTRDIDDAFIVKKHTDGGWTVHIALACPAIDWPFGSKLDKAVLHRASSLYLPEKTCHMLPKTLSTETYSLLQKTVRPALTIECRISADGEILFCEPNLSRVNIAANLTYEMAEKLLTGESFKSDAHIANILHALELAKARLNCRLCNNAIVIERDEPEFTLEKTEKDIRVIMQDMPDTRQAHLLVSELMILSNAGLALWAKEHNLPLLHRTQDIAIPTEYAGIWKKPHDISRVIRTLTSAILEVCPRPHAGLGESNYAPTTSPLRRYSDMINEAQIINMLRYGIPRWTEEELNSMLPLLNVRLDAAGQVQRMRQRYWKFVYIQQHGDSHWWQGIVTDENETSVYVTLPREQIFLKGKRNIFDERCHIGQEVEVRLHKINPHGNEIYIAESREKS